MAQPQASRHERRNSTSSSNSNSSSGSRSPRAQYRSFWAILDPLPQRTSAPRSSPPRSPTRRSSHSKIPKEVLDPLSLPPSPSRSPTRKSSHSKVAKELLPSPPPTPARTSSREKIRKQSTDPLAPPLSPSRPRTRASSPEKLPKKALDPLTPPPSPTRTPKHTSSHSTIPEEDLKLWMPPSSSSRASTRASSPQKLPKRALDPLTTPPSLTRASKRTYSNSTIPEKDLKLMAIPPSPSPAPTRTSSREDVPEQALDQLTPPPSPTRPPTGTSSHPTNPKKSLDPLTPLSLPSRSTTRTSSHSSPKQASDSKTKKAHREHTKAELPDATQPQAKAAKLYSFAKRMESKSRKLQEERVEDRKVPQKLLEPMNSVSVQTQPISLTKLEANSVTNEPVANEEEGQSEKTYVAQVEDSKMQQLVSPLNCLSVQTQSIGSTKPATESVESGSSANEVEGQSEKHHMAYVEDTKLQQLVSPTNCSVQTQPISLTKLEANSVTNEPVAKEDEGESEKPCVAHFEEAKMQPLAAPMNCLAIQPPTPPKGKVIIHCLRHAQAFHNLGMLPRSERLNILDPGLTPEGKAQAKKLCKTLGSTTSITHILSSPLRRTMQTAVFGLAPIIEKGLKVIAYPDIREWGSSPCSTGSKMRDLLHKVPNAEQRVDTSLVPSGWEVNHEKKKNTERVERVKIDLWNLGNESLKERGRWRGKEVGRGERKGGEDKDVEIVVVSHAAFLGTLEGTDVERLRNAQWRTYEFATEEDMKTLNCKPYALFETAESKRRNDPVLPTPEEAPQIRKKIEAEKAKEKARTLRRGW